MDDGKLDRERERALGHPMRRAIFDALTGGDRTAPQLRAALPDVAPVVIDAPPPLAIVTYHLRILHRARLVGCVGGLYRALG